MSTKRYKAGGFADPATLPRGEHGRVLCRQCGEEVQTGRITFCSDDCVHQWRLRTDGAYLRRQVWNRDRGWCDICGMNTEALRRRLITRRQAMIRRHAIHMARRWNEGRPYRPHEQSGGTFFNAFLLRVGGKKLLHRWHTSLWDADHIVPVCEGGGQSGLSNIRTLCLWCHGKATAALAARRAAK